MKILIMSVSVMPRGHHATVDLCQQLLWGLKMAGQWKSQAGSDPEAESILRVAGG